MLQNLPAQPMTIGRFTLLNPLGEGGMARVYRAQMRGEAGFSKIVAIKIIRPELAISDPDFVRRFISEARLGGYVHHPAIVETYDFGEDDGRYFIAMEYVNGPTLHALIRSHLRLQTPIPTEIALELIGQAADGLQAAHQARDMDGTPLSLVHRDIKPSNILLTRDGHVKIADFGVARASSNISHTLHTGVIRGTLRFMSPEQAWGRRDIDHRSDIFSLGAVLFELATGRRLYEGDAVALLLRRAQDGDHIPLEGCIPPGPLAAPLLEVLERSLAVDREARFQTAREMRSAILSALDNSRQRPRVDSWLEAAIARDQASPEPAHDSGALYSHPHGPMAVSQGSVPSLHDADPDLDVTACQRPGPRPAAAHDLRQEHGAAGPGSLSLAPSRPASEGGQQRDPSAVVARGAEPSAPRMDGASPAASVEPSAPDHSQPGTAAAPAPSSSPGARRWAAAAVALLLAGGAYLALRPAAPQTTAQQETAPVVAERTLDPSAGAPPAADPAPAAEQLGGPAPAAPLIADPPAPALEPKAAPPAAQPVAQAPAKAAPPPRRPAQAAARSPDPAPAPEKPAPQAAPSGPPGALYAGMPFGATVRLDGKVVGTTPLRGEAIPSGRHTLSFTLTSGEVLSAKVSVPAGGDLHCRVAGEVQCE